MNTSLEFVTYSPEETQQLGRQLGKIARAGDVFLLSGGLGVGKTCLTQGIAWGLGISEYARSPSFVMVTEYQGRLPLYHADLYRLDTLEEVIDLGIDEYLCSDGVFVVEWAERLTSSFVEDHLAILIKSMDRNTRQLRLEANGPSYVNLLERIEEPSTKAE